MTTSLKPIALTTFALLIVLGIGSASHPAAALSTEDSAGNPDVAAPLTDPDDSQSSGFTMTLPTQDGSSGGLQWGFGNQSIPSTDSGDGQSQ